MTKKEAFKFLTEQQDARSTSLPALSATLMRTYKISANKADKYVADWAKQYKAPEKKKGWSFKGSEGKGN